MTTSVVIRSPSPNNHQVVVLAQTIDDNGDSAGAPQILATLDDGQETVQHVWKNRALVIVELPRNSDLAVLAPSQRPDDAGDPPVEVVHVIGGTVEVPASGDGEDDVA